MGAVEPVLRAVLSGCWHLLPAWLPGWPAKAMGQLPVLCLEDRARQPRSSCCGVAGLPAEQQGCEGCIPVMPETQPSACTGHAEAVVATDEGRVLLLTLAGTELVGSEVAGTSKVQEGLHSRHESQTYAQLAGLI